MILDYTYDTSNYMIFLLKKEKGERYT